MQELLSQALKRDLVVYEDQILQVRPRLAPRPAPHLRAWLPCSCRLRVRGNAPPACTLMPWAVCVQITLECTWELPHKLPFYAALVRESAPRAHRAISLPLLSVLHGL